MIDLNYYEIGQRIKSRRKELNLTQPELAGKVNLSVGSVSKYENGKVEDATTSKLNDFAKALDVDIVWLIGAKPKKGENQNNVTKIPILGKIAAGLPIMAIEDANEWITVDKADKVDFALEVQGDSMIGARIYDGDIIFVRKQPTVQNGEIAAVQISEGFIGTEEVTCKRFYRYGNTILLKSENPTYADIEIKLSKHIDNQIIILGKIIFLKGYIS